MCSSKQNLYIIAGFCNDILKSCFVYNINYDIWIQIADMNNEIYRAACTVYEGKIVVSGDWFESSSVEAYDYSRKFCFIKTCSEFTYSIYGI